MYRRSLGQAVFLRGSELRISWRFRMAGRIFSVRLDCNEARKQPFACDSAFERHKL